ncbi:translation machinery-associated protein 22 [Senna tora]|uniref:Translation machinery-associated protein 22 n=1 Tax=Senna tora TaxID=362788 RepID=A0A834X4L1_9FABA|nr:translation machinery-associated protein 22 [Senna tora]
MTKEIHIHRPHGEIQRKSEFCCCSVMAEKPQPVRVLYCPVCSLPAEYCEFGPDFEKCKPWLIQNAPQLYPDLVKDASGKDADKVAEQLQSTGISSGASDGAATSVLLRCQVPQAPKQEEVKRLPGGKIKKKEKQEVVIEKVIRNKRKCITTVKGLDLFGVKLSEASKKLGKKFATGASVVKGPTEKEQIDVQGDISYDIVEFITDTWPDVPETAIFFIEDGRKVPAA